MTKIITDYCKDQDLSDQFMFYVSNMVFANLKKIWLADFSPKQIGKKHLKRIITCPSSLRFKYAYQEKLRELDSRGFSEIWCDTHGYGQGWHYFSS